MEISSQYEPEKTLKFKKRFGEVMGDRTIWDLRTQYMVT